MGRQSCVICAWRENCGKRFSVSDGGARCPDFTRDLRIKETADEEPADGKEQNKQ